MYDLAKEVSIAIDWNVCSFEAIALCLARFGVDLRVAEKKGNFGGENSRSNQKDQGNGTKSNCDDF